MVFRAIRLVGIAAQAESRRLKVHAGSYVNRAAYAAAAALFGVAALAMLHVLAYNAMWRWAGPTGSALIVLVVDLIVAGVLAFVATRGGRADAEIEARAVRDTALSAAAEEMLFGFVKRSAPMAAAGGLLLALMRRR